MSDFGSLLPNLVSGLLTGTAGAGTTLLAFFKEQKKKIQNLEHLVGSDEKEPKTGLFYSVAILAQDMRRLRAEVESWRDDPPDWVVRAARRSSVNIEGVAEIEQRVETRLRSFAQALKRLEDDYEAREEARERSNPALRTFLTRDEYEEDSRKRAMELSKVKDNMSDLNRWLRGIMTSLGYLESEPKVPESNRSPKRKP